MRQLDHVMAIHPDFEPVASRYEALGFQLTEISHHPMGTGNRLMIFASNFMEILAVTRPELIARDTTDVVGDYLSARTGITGIAVRSESQQQDLTAFAASDVPGVGGFSFQRPVSLPNGRDGMADVDVVVSRNAATPLVFYFTSHQKRPEAIEITFDGESLAEDRLARWRKECPQSYSDARKLMAAALLISSG